MSGHKAPCSRQKGPACNKKTGKAKDKAERDAPSTSADKGAEPLSLMNQGKALIESGHVKDGLERLRDAFRASKREHGWQRVTVAMCAFLCTTLTDHDMHPESTLYCEAALNNAEEAFKDEPALRQMIVHRAADAYMRSDQPDRALPLWHELLHDFSWTQDDMSARRAHAALHLAECLMKAGRNPEAVQSYKQCMELSKRAKDQFTMFQATKALFKIFTSTHQPAAAAAVCKDYLSHRWPDLVRVVRMRTYMIQTMYAHTMAQCGYTIRAIQLLTSTLSAQRQDPDCHEYHCLRTTMYLGAAYLEAGDHGKAVRVLAATWDSATRTLCYTDAEDLTELSHHYEAALAASGMTEMQDMVRAVASMHGVRDKQPAPTICSCCHSKTACTAPKDCYFAPAKQDSMQGGSARRSPQRSSGRVQGGASGVQGVGSAAAQGPKELVLGVAVVNRLDSPRGVTMGSGDKDATPLSKPTRPGTRQWPQGLRWATQDEVFG